MRAYVGQTRSRALVRELEARGIGECCVRGELPPRRSSWFYDNGAYTDFEARRPFDTVQFTRDMRAIRAGGKGAGRRGELKSWPRPDFLVLPDIVAGGLDSLRFSLDWCRGLELPPAVAWYLAVQDGMSLRDVTAACGCSPISGLFVGGTLEWKLREGPAWVEHGHTLGLPVHVGRVGTLERVRWARDIGADSVDSSFPLWNTGRLQEWIVEVSDLAPQGRLIFS